ncbi:MAG: prephenate dehydrogenase/arogenate dehydrogenase family protein, partial [Bacteroidetes bacterium]|nr:prephenate dehydrogenase/arogenate dehydrogenase family protein [Bacteroidota bacterium]
MKVTIIGLGLIGGSMALDLRKAGVATKLMGLDQNLSNAKKAVDLKIVDEVLPENEALAKADLVILAIPVNALCAFLPSVLDAVNKNAVVIDAGSTKKMICNSVANHPKRNQFVASHPIAGTEFSGPEAAFNGLFENKTNIICEQEKSSAKALTTAEKVFKTLGMNTIFMEPEEHDKH